jgi:hypothetical protein
VRYLITRSHINKQINRVVNRRRYTKIFTNDFKPINIKHVSFLGDNKYKTRLITAKSNDDSLRLCKKSGSWVSIRFGGSRVFFWTSRYLNYFKDLSTVTHTRNFGNGIIRSADFLILRDACISNTPKPNSLNIYSHEIKKSKQIPDIDNAFYFCVNGSNSFQHFIQDLLPILSLAQPFLQENPSMPLILTKPNMKFNSFEEFFKLIDVKNPKIFIDDDKLCVRNLHVINFNPINAIYSLPQELYAKMHQSIEKAIPKIGPKQKNLVLLVRNEETRNFSNLVEICERISQKAESFNLTPVFINPSNLTLEEVIEVMSNAEYIFGVHGGAMYNFLFAPPGATVVEFITTTDTDSLLHIIMSSGLNYFPYAIKSGKGDTSLTITVDDLDCIFESLDKSRRREDS